MPGPIRSRDRTMQRVLILGATSAIAGEAAQIYAGRGDHLFLVGRSETKLADVAKRCAEAQVATAQADFTALERNEGLIADAFELLGGVDTALIAHGDLGDQLATERSFEDAERALRTNLLSVISLLIPLAN
jgi:decaprenylphospho-beta-D-erythro-pentofuranosid-2-ulose 2-reductase